MMSSQNDSVDLDEAKKTADVMKQEATDAVDLHRANLMQDLVEEVARLRQWIIAPTPTPDDDD